jgi:peptidoglycan-N-acetylglucosamine deacetylase
MLRHKYIIILCLATLVLLFWLNLAWYYYVYLFLFWFIMTIWGSFDIRLSYFTKSYYQAKVNTAKEIAITFDDGPHEMTEKILDVLLKFNVKATFFCIGSQIEQHPEVFKRIISEGHIIGNHSYSHSKGIGFFSTSKMIEEITKTNAIITPILGKKTKLFRPPFGVTNPKIARAVKNTEMNVIGWNIRSLDTVIKDEEDVFQRVKRKLVPGGIILLHDTSEKSVIVLERLLLFLQSENYNVITVDKLLNLKAYED